MRLPCQHTQNTAGCRVCFLYATRPEYRQLWDDNAPLPTKVPAVSHQTRRLPMPRCEHIGSPVRTSAGNRYHCKKGINGEQGIKPCQNCGPSKCPSYQAEDGQYVPKGDLIPKWMHRFGDGLVAGQNTNCSMIPFNGKLLLAYRHGWHGSRIHIATLDNESKIQSVHVVELSGHVASGAGQEDPRLFVHDDELYLAFTGVRMSENRPVARQLFAKLDGDFNANRIWEPQLPSSALWEKNWQPFSAEGRLWVVYSMVPWVVMELLADGTAKPLPAERGIPWEFGHVRGGAAPWKKDGRFYSFFHGTDKRPHVRPLDGLYTMGVCEFEGTYPFRPLRMTKEPILSPNIDERPDIPGEPGRKWWVATIFPCGAYFDDGEWVVSYGYNDHWCRVSGFAEKDVEERLVDV